MVAVSESTCVCGHDRQRSGLVFLQHNIGVVNACDAKTVSIKQRSEDLKDLYSLYI